MTPEQCRELAEYHEHMAERNDRLADAAGTVYGDAATAMRVLNLSASEHRESARYWREKADG